MEDIKGKILEQSLAESIDLVDGSDQPGIKTLDKGLRILDFFASKQRSFGVSDIAREFSMDKGSAYRFLTTLERSGVLSQDFQTKKYGLGTKFLVWASRAGPMTTVVRVSRPYLEELAQVTGLEAHLALMSHQSAVLVDTASPDTPMSIRSLVGLEEPLHSTALGKAILAFQPEAKRNELIKSIPMRAATSNTITDRAKLAEAVEEIRRTGIATDFGEFIEVLTCFAAPVFDADESVFAAMGVSVISGTLTEKDERALHKQILTVTDRLTKHLNPGR
ncbi:IclR family transcriptional regulator [Mesorhizobium sp. B2-4-15]|uniref:IclR family transcriptional regulator n=1 Tax=Mesorhizobium sp. B2-4-15 TaxID=2589934 RepID=UPI00114D512F|nr:IclR family transcriptional regulator [Mesorhizobium sp. B2-4-15]TPK73597.1 IclR family transcriptional regulator [Mesorhizobium sp. B2-4-15]